MTCAPADDPGLLIPSFLRQALRSGGAAVLVASGPPATGTVTFLLQLLAIMWLPTAGTVTLISAHLLRVLPLAAAVALKLADAQPQSGGHGGDGHCFRDGQRPLPRDASFHFVLSHGPLLRISLPNGRLFRISPTMDSWLPNEILASTTVSVSALASLPRVEAIVFTWSSSPSA